MTDELLRTIGSIEIILCAILANSFCVIYHSIARWWKSEVGRHIMLFSATLSVVLDLWFIGLIFGGNNDWFRILRVAAFAGIPYVLGRQIWILLKSQRQGEEKTIMVQRNERVEGEMNNDESST